MLLKDENILLDRLHCQYFLSEILCFWIYGSMDCLATVSVATKACVNLFIMFIINDLVNVFYQDLYSVRVCERSHFTSKRNPSK